ncbi:MAG: radical SAM family heme chaperone HemW [Saccharofermentans sp.]|nr:radical SAM family heme chaperone HemW [Saccharofermentans sp.]
MHIYVHVPFCAAKCPYCSFYSITKVDLASSYFDALIREIKACEEVPSAALSNEISTIYFGGGTPSYVDSKLVCDALCVIREKFSLTDRGEYTIEANPNSLTLDKARAYKAAGFNRISIGIQSLHDETLRLLGRLHNRKEALKAIEIALEAGFTNVSGDLIIGVPGQTIEDLYEDAKALIDIGVKHISMYSLSIEEGTPFYAKYGDKLSEYVDEDTEREMYHGLRKYLSSFGIEPYEISNCAIPGFESNHNNAYWSANEYYAFGSGSHGYLNSQRFAHVDDVCAYINNPLKRTIEETLDEEDKMHEFSMLSLRTSSGIDKVEFKKRYGKSVHEVFEKQIVSNVSKGLLIEDSESIRLTSKGLDLANQVFMDFL